MCWSDGYHYNNVFRSSNYIWFLLFSFLQPMLHHSHQIRFDDRGLFSVVYKDSNLCNYVKPSHNEGKKLKSSFHNIMRLWFSGNFEALVNPNLPLKVLSTRCVHSALKQHRWCQLTLCRCSQCRFLTLFGCYWRYFGALM